MLLYPAHTLEKLEFDKVLALVSRYCQSEPAKEMALSLQPLTDAAEIRKQLLYVRDFRQVSISGAHFPLEYAPDLSREISLMGIADAVLEQESFTRIKRTALTIEGIFRFFAACQGLYPDLESILAGTYYEKQIAGLINGVFDENANVKDNASRDLLDIRNNLGRKRNELNRAFSQILQRFAKLGILTDSGQSIRNGRKVVSITAESKRQVGGIIHDESDSGKTAFVEPAETVALNNEIFELERAEEREIYRILRELTALLSTYRQLIASYQAVLTRLDLIRAKSRFADEVQASYPLLSDRPVINLRKARHPLLFLHQKKLKKETVPLNLKLDETNRILVISGPNAGGKTICLKTIGLLQVMLQSGLHVPADERSEMGIFQSLFLDIGDSQSIEDELSTYSSHLKAMRFFIDNADKRSMFLIDEFGTGSDPALGGAFAEAILEELAFRRAYGIVTTHYLNLKVMANKVKGIMNGAMIFNEETLMPTYQLAVGKPGSSYTFAIAERTGLPRMLIERAKDLVDQQHYQLDLLLNKVEQEHQLLLGREKELSQRTEELNALKKNYEQLLARVQQQRERSQQAIIKQGEKTTPFIREAEKRLQKLLQDWQTRKDLEVVAAKTKELLKTETPKTKKAEANREALPAEKLSSPAATEKRQPLKLEIGMKVKVVSFNKTGTVESIKGNKVTVLTDELRVVVPREDLSI